MSILFVLVPMLLATLGFLFFGDTTSAGVNEGGYVAIPQAVRDFYSREVLYKAQPRLRFLQFAKIKRDLQAVRGKAIVFVKYDNLEGGGGGRGRRPRKERCNGRPIKGSYET